MDLSQIEKCLEDSLEDYVLSRSERKEFKSLLLEVRGDSKAEAMLRGLAFRLANQKFEESPLVLEWLENVIKTIYSKERKVSQKAYFSPGNDCLNEIRSFIAEARSSLDICVFTITDNRIVDKIFEAQQRGVAIRVVADDDKSEDLGADVKRMKQNGINVVFDVTEAHMHHKFAISDTTRLLNGSYNWTRAAASENNENIFISNDRELVSSYQAEFDRLWNMLLPKQ